MSEFSPNNIKKFNYRKEDDYYIVWLNEESAFIELDQISFNVLIQLSQGISPSQISREHEKELGEPIEIEEFIESLKTHGFIGEKTFHKPSTLPFIKPKHVSWLYNKTALKIYGAIILIGTIILFSNPGYFPEYDDFFISDSYFSTLFITLIIGIIFISIHELSHLLSGRAQGVYGRIGLGLRLYYPVAETDLTGLWRLEREKRYLPIMAGLLSDLVIGSTSIILLYVSDKSVLSLPIFYTRLIEASILVIWYSILWQFMLFLKTDLYYALSTLLGVRNLFEESWNLVYRIIKSLGGKEVSEQSFPERDKLIIRIYAVIVLVFSVYSVFIFTLYGIPIYSIIIFDSIENIRTQTSFPLMLNNISVLFFAGIQILAFTYFLLKSLMRCLRS